MAETYVVVKAVSNLARHNQSEISSSDYVLYIQLETDSC